MPSSLSLASNNSGSVPNSASTPALSLLDSSQTLTLSSESSGASPASVPEVSVKLGWATKIYQAMMSLPRGIKASFQEYLDGFKLSRPYFMGRSRKHIKHWVLLSLLLSVDLLQTLVLYTVAYGTQEDALVKAYGKSLKDIEFTYAGLLKIGFLAGRSVLTSMFFSVSWAIKDFLRFYLKQSLTIEMKSKLLKEWVETHTYFGENFKAAVGMPVDDKLNAHQVLEHDIESYADHFLSNFINSSGIIINLTQGFRRLGQVVPSIKKAYVSKDKGLGGLLLLQILYGSFSYGLSRWIYKRERTSAEAEALLEHATDRNLQAFTLFSESVAMRGGAAYELNSLLKYYQSSSIKGAQQHIIVFKSIWNNLEWKMRRCLEALILADKVQARYPFVKDYMSIQETTGNLIEAANSFTKMQSAHSNLSLENIKAFQYKILCWQAVVAESRRHLTRSFSLSAGSIAIKDLNMWTVVDKVRKDILPRCKIEIPLDGDSIILLSGPSGIGKSVLFKVLLELYPFASGHITLPLPKEHILVGPQKLYSPRGATLLEVIRFPDSQILSGNEEIQIVYLAEQFGLTEKFGWGKGMTSHEKIAALNKNDFTLSGGEEQRLAIISLLLQIWRMRDVEGKILVLMDENFSQLDEENKKIIQTLIKGLKKNWSIKAHLTIICIDHHPLLGQGTDFYQTIIRFTKEEGIKEPEKFTPKLLKQLEASLTVESKEHREHSETLLVSTTSPNHSPGGACHSGCNHRQQHQHSHSTSGTPPLKHGTPPLHAQTYDRTAPPLTLNSLVAKNIIQ